MGWISHGREVKRESKEMTRSNVTVAILQVYPVFERQIKEVVTSVGTMAEVLDVQYFAGHLYLQFVSMPEAESVKIELQKDDIYVTLALLTCDIDSVYADSSTHEKAYVCILRNLPSEWELQDVLFFFYDCAPVSIIYLDKQPYDLGSSVQVRFQNASDAIQAFSYCRGLFFIMSLYLVLMHILCRL